VRIFATAVVALAMSPPAWAETLSLSCDVTAFLVNGQPWPVVPAGVQRSYSYVIDLAAMTVNGRPAPDLTRGNNAISWTGYGSGAYENSLVEKISIDRITGAGQDDTVAGNTRKLQCKAAKPQF